MTRSRLAAFVTAAAAIAASQASAAPPVTTLRALTMELVGQVTNSPAGVTPSTSVQVGYVSYLRGLPVFKSQPESEATALFTFYLRATTLRVVADGPLRVVSRQGEMTVYRNPAGGAAFGSPDSFRAGAPVLVVGLRQEVVIDTITGGFTTHNVNRVTEAASFPAGSGRLRLAGVGAHFETFFQGHLNMPGPPSGFFAGYTFTPASDHS